MNHPRAPIHRRRANASPLRRDVAAFAIFFALVLVMTNSLALHLASAVEDQQDALLNTWIIAWVGHALITDPLNLFNANIFYPYSNTLAFSETMLPQGILALPFNLAFDNTVLGYNLVLLFSFFLAAYAMYLFVFDLTHSRPAAIIAGTIFSFNPYNLGNLAQVQLLSFGWMPLVLLFLKPVLLGRSEKNFKFCFLFALFFSLQCLSSFYYAFLAGITVALNLVVFLLVRRSRGFSFHAQLFKRLVISTAIIAVLVVPFFLPYLQVQRDLGFERKVAESEPFSASLKLYSEVSPQNLVYGNFLAPRPQIFSGGYPQDNLFPGLIALALAIIGIVATKNRERWFYFLLLAFAFLLSLGPRLYLTPTQPTNLTLPYRWLYDFFPLMRAFRAPVRFDALVIFALGVLAGIGVTRFKITNYQLSIAIFLIAFEYLALPAAQITAVPVWSEIPEYVRWLAKQPPGVVLELPMIASDPLDLTTQYLSTYHWHPTPDGYSGFNPKSREEIADNMKHFPMFGTTELLQALDVNYLIIHTDQISDWNTLRGGQTSKGAIECCVPEIKPVQQFGNDLIYRVAPHAQDPAGLSPRLYLPNPITPNSNYTAYLIVVNLVVENHEARAYAVKPTDALLINAEWSDGTKQQIKAALPLVIKGEVVVPVRLLTPPHEGTYQLELKMTGGGVGGWDLSGDVSVRNEEPAHQVVLPVQVTSDNETFKRTYAPGDTIAISLWWFPSGKVDAYYSVSIRVVDANGNKVAQQDRQPATPTFLWSDYMVPFNDTFKLVLPRDLSPGEYSVQVKMYQAEQGVDALLLQNTVPREIVALGTFTVK